MHKFKEQHIPGRTDAIVAFEMANVKIPIHLIQLRGIGYCPPWPQVHDIMYYYHDLATPHKVQICVIRKVVLPQHLQEEGVLRHEIVVLRIVIMKVWCAQK